MKKKRNIIVLILIVLAFLCFFNRKPEEIRTRVIPNSNEASDLAIKEEVKVVVINFLEKNYHEDMDTYIDNIKSNLINLENTFSKMCYEVKTELTYHNFYNKTYNDNSIKNEEVLTLLVTIGEGKGDNWWGSVYPEFLEMNSSQEVQYKSWFKEIYERIWG